MPLRIKQHKEDKPRGIPISKVAPLEVFYKEEDHDDDPVLFMRVMDNDETGIACVPLGCLSGSSDVDGVGEVESLSTKTMVIIVDAELHVSAQ